MNRWWVYIKERFPLPVYALLVGGYTASTSLFYPPANHISFSAYAIGLAVFFFLLRLMDEYKDHEKDKIVHPDRPIPRGLFSASEVKRAIQTLEWIMIAYSVFLMFTFSIVAGLCYLFICLHLWGMFKEFYFHKLSDYPLFYAITHQVILIPIVWLGVWLAHPEQPINLEMIAYGAFSLGAFFSYEICRKLDPESNKLNKTYLQFYGPVKVALVVAILVSMSAWGASVIHLHNWIYFIQAAFVATLILPILAPTKYKITEAASVLLLVTNIWAIAFERWFS